MRVVPFSYALMAPWSTPTPPAAETAPLDAALPAQPPAMTVATAMGILEKAREQPECRAAVQAVQAARQQMQAAQTAQVDAQQYVGRSMSNWGIWAVCGVPMAAMIILSKSGLTGTAAIAGLVGGFLVAPAIALWLVKRHGLEQAKERQAELDRLRVACQDAVKRCEAAELQVMQMATDRLYKEEQARLATHPAPPAATVSASDTSVKIGNVTVSKRPLA